MQTNIPEKSINIFEIQAFKGINVTSYKINVTC